MDSLQISTLLLGASIGALWIPVRYLWCAIFAAFVIQALSSCSLSIMALLTTAGLGVLCIAVNHSELSWWVRGGLIVILTIVAVIFGLHLLPGYGVYTAHETIQLSPDSAVFPIRFYFDKPLVGLFVIATLSSLLIKDWGSVLELCKTMALPFVIGTCCVYAIGLSMGYARFDLTVHSVFFIWAIKNLVFTVVAEEGLFRGVIQHQLARIIPHDKGKEIAWVIGAVLFGIAHYAGGVQYVFLSTLAGLLYGYVFLKTGRIEGAILAHFGLNALHFLLFSYPYYIGP